ncbi:MAG: hypothetical protein QW594_01970 [Candidatus Woesearchaeota archaeon]
MKKRGAQQCSVGSVLTTQQAQRGQKQMLPLFLFQRAYAQRAKKAQVTNFLILVGVLALMVVAYFFLKRLIVYDVSPYPVISPQFQEVQEYVQNCLFQHGKEAIVLAGLQGGYVELPKKLEANPNAHLQLVPGGPGKVPYWYNKGFTYMPSQQEIERQLASYVEEKIASCTDQFRVFEGIYQITQQPPKAKVSLQDNTVTIELNYPLSVIRLDTNEHQEMVFFRQVFDARLLLLYKLARDVHTAELRTNYLEHMTINFLAMDEKIPITGMEFVCGRKSWNVDDVKTELQKTLLANVPNLRIDKTKYRPFTDDETYEKLHMLWKVSDVSYPELRIGAMVSKDWPYGFRVRPAEGKKMYARHSKAFTDYLSSFCINIYHFTYDISYPVLFSLVDDKSFGGEGLQFLFAEPVIISHNKPSREQYAISDFLVPSYAPDFCSQQTEQQFNILAYDLRTGLDIDQANITYQCATKLCPLGVTRYQDQYYLLKTTFPKRCMGGTLVAEAKGYRQASIPVELENHPLLYRIGMIPLITVNYTVIKHTPDNPVLKRSLRSDEEVFITLENPSFGIREIVGFPNLNNATIALIGNTTTYNITAYLLRSDRLIGGYLGAWEYEYDDIADAKTLVFHVFDFRSQVASQGSAFDDETLYTMLKSYNYSLFEPEIIPYSFGEILP